MVKKSEIISRINACEQELAALDYARCKVAMELAEKLKVKFPDLSLPEYEKYAAREEAAKARRAEIDNLRAQLPTAEDDE